MLRIEIGINPSDGYRDSNAPLATLAFRALPALPPLLMAQSLFWSARVPAVLKLATALVGLLGLISPDRALLIVVGLLPVTHVVATRLWDLYPLALSEGLILAWLSGYLARRCFGGGGTPVSRSSPLRLSAWLFTLTVVASAAVQFVVVQIWHDDPWPYTRSFCAYLIRDYLTSAPDPRPWDDGRGFVYVVALHLESVALLLITQRLCSKHPALLHRLATMAAIGGTGAALINLLEAATAALRGEPGVWHQRWSGFIPSINTSGAFLLLPGFAAAGLVSFSARGLAPLLALLLIGSAIVLNGTRAAIFAAGAVMIVWIGWVATATRRLNRRVLTAVVLASGGMAISLALFILLVNPFHILAPDAYDALWLRRLLAETALRMVATWPFFGAGPAQFGVRYREFAPPELLRLMPAADAHNYFLWIAAELGLAGLGSFLFLMVAAGRAAWHGLQENPFDRCRSGLCAGLAAFVLTWLSGQPLMVPLVAYTFWILLGAVASETGRAR